MITGVVSDTHGLLRPEVVHFLAGVDLILHAGDVGKPGIIDDLMDLAPVIAIRGNVDRDDWATTLPPTEVVELENFLVYMIHDLGDLDIDPVVAGIDAVIIGHSHMPKADYCDGVLYLNPGSAGPRRFRLPVSVALLRVDGTTIVPELLELSA